VDPANFVAQCAFMPITPRYLHGWAWARNSAAVRWFHCCKGIQPLAPDHTCIAFGTASRSSSRNTACSQRLISEIQVRAGHRRLCENRNREVFGAIWYRQGEAFVYLVNMSSRNARGTAAFDPAIMFGPAVASSAKKLLARAKAPSGPWKSPHGNQDRGPCHTISALESGLFQHCIAHAMTFGRRVARVSAV